MSFRRRTVLLAAGAVAAAIVIASAVVYVVTRDQLRGQIDASLRATITPGLPQAVQIKPSPAELAKLQRQGKLSSASAVPLEHGGQVHVGGEVAGESGGVAVPTKDATSIRVHTRAKGANTEEVMIERRTVIVPKGTVPRSLGGGAAAKLELPSPKFGGPIGYVQLSQPNGNVLHAGRGPLLPMSATAHAVAQGRHSAFFSDRTIDGTQARVLTERAPAGGVWFVAEPLTNLNNTLEHLRLVLAIVCLGGIALAAALGLLVSRAALLPVKRLTGAAEDVARTQDLGHRIEARGEDELGRLADSFNTMLAALERSRQSPRQLVSDASHELRTPLTSVQTNLDALALGEQLSESERARILASTRAQLGELTVLVGDLIDLSKTDVDELEVEDVRLDIAVAGAIERAQLHAPSARFELELEPCLVCASPRRLDRAISNLLDNAIKWNPSSPSAVAVQVLVRDGRVEVRDHGPGISPEDLPRVFDRFYRAPAARARPGSGIGLAIVRQVAETHGGAVRAINDPGGGARLILELPALLLTDTELAAASAAQQVC
ncbi:MAG: sensor histidine kinase [Solirubrobacteraceae bacterium]